MWLRSLWSKAAILVVIFLAVPTFLYSEFREVENQKNDLVIQSVQGKGLIIARSLSEVLLGSSRVPFVDLPQIVTRYSSEDVQVRLLFRPAGDDAAGFFYVASAPTVSSEKLSVEREKLVSQGVIGKLRESCAGDIPLALRVQHDAGASELLTSITPVQSERGCWAVIVSHTRDSIVEMGAGEPYWKSREVQIAGASYIAVALLVLFIFHSVWRDLRRFGHLARDIRRSGRAGSFSDWNTVPELHDVAASLDGMVDALDVTSDNLRRAAEDNAHALKTPIGVIQQSLEPLKRRIPEEDERSTGALQAISSAVARLEGLVSSARRLDRTAADLLDPPREAVDLSKLTAALVAAYRTSAAPARRITFSAEIPGGLVVSGGEEIIETVIENIIDNAVSFSPDEGEIRVVLSRERHHALLVIDDQGPGIPEERAGQVFDRYYSERDAGSSDEAHFGIGLWIVRRNLEAIGGVVRLTNKPDGGLAVEIRIPLYV